MSRADKKRTVADASYQGDGWWLIRLSCGHQWRVLHGVTSPRGSTVHGCVTCDQAVEDRTADASHADEEVVP